MIDTTTLLLIFVGSFLGAIAGKSLFSHLKHRRWVRIYKQAEPMVEHATRELYRLPRKKPPTTPSTTSTWMSFDWKTLCEKCKHHMPRYDSERSHTWYNHFCEKAPLRNDDKLPIEHRYEVCRNINTDGACKLFEATP